MPIDFQKPELTELKPKITVIGVGGAGGNAVNNMIDSGLNGVDFVAANTDAQALTKSLAEQRVQLGINQTRGLGAGARPEVGREAAEEALDEMISHIDGANMVFITAGMGGGTGTGAAPVVARAAREKGVLTVGVVTKPFHFEGRRRMKLAEEGIKELQQNVDTLIVIPNQNLFRMANDSTSLADAFSMADQVLHSGVRGITDLMLAEGLINLDFADICTVMSEMGKAMMGTGEAEGDRRAIDAAEAAISNPLLDEVSLKGAKGVVINITGGHDLNLMEVDEAVTHITDQVDPDANIIFGAAFDENLNGKFRITVVATGIEAETGTMAEPQRPRIVNAKPVVEEKLEDVEVAIEEAAIETEVVASEKDIIDINEEQSASEPVAFIDDLVEEETAPVETASTPDLKPRPFIAPEPMRPSIRPAAKTQASADTRQAAAPSLLDKMGFGRRMKMAEQAEQQQTSATIGRLDPADRPAPERVEDDPIDIPAFFRNQAN
ncbi:MAG: cell division protein FtsZ [Sphingomonadales bacterium]|jgi:cell division protein FtsZ